MKFGKHTKAYARSGFALIATISVMILLVMVALAMLSLSTIELRSSRNSQATAEAQANARLALMMAIGELQRELGPDSRISAPHDAGNLAPDGQPHWVAVYDAWERNPDSNDPETPQTRDPKFRGWLVSGANQTNSGSTNGVLLVGPNSLDDAATADDQVSVPMHTVGSSTQNGRIAWWISDEAAKAKINAGPDTIVASSFDISDSLFHAQSPPNIGHRVFPKLTAFDWKQGQRAGTLSTAGVNLAAGLGSSGIGNTSHDLTVHSVGVLADVRRGRLKRDLSNLLSRPITELEDKPLFLADGRMNEFEISEDGTVSNSSVIASNAAGTGQEWGINIEELSLFHNLPKALTWNGGKPTLATKSSREEAVKDRHFVYNKPCVNAAQFILSLKAVSTGGDNYKMQMMLDGVVALHNPNDVHIEVTQGLALPFQLLNVPYTLNWNIGKSNGSTLTTQSNMPNLAVFRGYVEGGYGGVPAAGFILEPGEAAAFGSTTASGFHLNLKRGFVPSGGVNMTRWNLNATELKKTDSVDFSFDKFTTPAVRSNYTYYNYWIGPRISGANGKGWQIDSSSLAGSSAYGDLLDKLLPVSIRPPQVLTVQDYINNPKPVLMFSFLRNVERSSGETSPDSFASRPFILNDPALSGGHSLITSDIEAVRHVSQMLMTAEPMNFQFRTLAAGAGGRNVYHGGGRQPGFGGSFNVISRRIPLSPPLSLGAFQNAIAFGLIHINEGAMPAIGPDPIPSYAVALSPHRKAKSLVVSQTIGNSFCPPFLDPSQVYRAKTGSGSKTADKSACDYSWMANTALWDSWFLSGIIDGTGTNISPWMTDARSPRAQFEALAKGEGLLRNKRFIFHPHTSVDDALEELFDGENFKPSGINQLSKYLLVDGAFNVNSTSAKAWEALLSSVRDQELLTAGGSTTKFDHPFGTLGYTASTETDGTEGDWMGLRSLSNSEIETLASAIVTEVKDRGPFLSMADFINRRPNSSDSTHQVVGALQAAIDRSGLNSRFVVAGRKVTAADVASLSSSNPIDSEPAPARAMGSAGHLSQGDLLTAIGSQITVRSDTFTIRAYGESLDVSGTKVLAKAWCEAVVQRLPEYIDTNDAPDIHDAWPQASTELSAVNKRFGRRLVIKSFRWLGGNEI